MDRWRTWNAQKLPGRAVNRYVRGWVRAREAKLPTVERIEVHRTACIVTHPPGGERMNHALVNPANATLAGTRFTPEECWRILHGDPTTGRWDSNLATYPHQAVDGLVTEFGGEELRAALQLQPTDANGHRCAVGRAVMTPAFFELRELYESLIHAVPPLYRAFADAPDAWAAALQDTYHAAFDVAQQGTLASLAVPLLGSGACGTPTEDAMRVAAEAAVSWRGQPGHGGAALTVRFGVQDSSTAHNLCDVLEEAMSQSSFVVVKPPAGECEQRWALPDSKAAHPASLDVPTG